MLLQRSRLLLGLCWVLLLSSSYSPHHIGIVLAVAEDNILASASATILLLRTQSVRNEEIPISGWGQHRYVYDPSMLPMPADASVEHAHGVVIHETDRTIIVTYKDTMQNSTRCLVRWRRNARRQPAEWLARGGGDNSGGDGVDLCQGVPHGLTLTTEEVESSLSETNVSAPSKTSFLYHANNEQRLHKTTLTGDIVWTVDGNLIFPSTASQMQRRQRIMRTRDHDDDKDDDSLPYRPTWFASQPESPFVFLADGYGSNRIFVLDKRTGNFTGHVFGGSGTDHGQFQTCHSITWDVRTNQMVVCDRENHRLEYFYVAADDNDPSVLEYSHTVSFDPLLRRPCNLRVNPSGDGYAIVPFLEGMVGILDQGNILVSYVNISDTLGQQGFLHPHDAHFVPGTDGDFVAVFWNPGRIGYFRRQQRS